MIRRTLQFALATGVPALLSFLALAIYSRLLPPDEYGRYALVAAVVAAANAILFQWLRSAIRRLLIAYGDRRAVLLSSVAVIYLCVAATAVAVALGVGAALFDSRVWTLAALGAMLLLSQAAFELNQDLILLEQRPIHYGYAGLARALVSLAVGVFLVSSGFGALGVITGAVVGYLTPATWFSLSHFRDASLERVAMPTVREIVVYGLPLTASFALQFVVDLSDRLLLGAYHGAAEVGRYAAPYDLCWQTLTLVMMTVNLAAFPLVVRALEERGEAAARAQLAEHGSVFLAIALPAAVGFGLLADPIARVLLGEAFRASGVQLMPVLAGAILLCGLKAYYFDMGLQLGNRTTGLALATLVSALVNVGINLVTVPRWGGLAAAWSTLIAYAVGLSLSIYLGRTALQVPVPWRAWTSVAMATAGMAAAILILPPLGSPVADLIAGIGIGMVTYMLLCIALDALGARARVRAYFAVVPRWLR